MKKIAAILLRIVFIPLNALIFLGLLSYFLIGINEIAFRLSGGSGVLDYRSRDFIEIFTFCIFAGVCLVLEIAAVFSNRLGQSSFLHGIRLGPFAALIVFGFSVIASDQLRIGIARYQIRAYIHQGTQTVPETEIYLHSDYRGFCGNGISARVEDLYFETASEGVNDPDPYVRARSLRISSRAADWLNGSDPRFEFYIAAACADENEVVRRAAADSAIWGTKCEGRTSKASVVRE